MSHLPPVHPTGPPSSTSPPTFPRDLAEHLLLGRYDVFHHVLVSSDHTLNFSGHIGLFLNEWIIPPVSHERLIRIIGPSSGRDERNHLSNVQGHILHLLSVTLAPRGFLSNVIPWLLYHGININSRMHDSTWYGEDPGFTTYANPCPLWLSAFYGLYDHVDIFIVNRACLVELDDNRDNLFHALSRKTSIQINRRRKLAMSNIQWQTFCRPFGATLLFRMENNLGDVPHTICLSPQDYGFIEHLLWPLLSGFADSLARCSYNRCNVLHASIRFFDFAPYLETIYQKIVDQQLLQSLDLRGSTAWMRLDKQFALQQFLMIPNLDPNVLCRRSGSTKLHFLVNIADPDHSSFLDTILAMPSINVNTLSEEGIHCLHVPLRECLANDALSELNDIVEAEPTYLWRNIHKVLWKCSDSFQFGNGLRVHHVSCLHFCKYELVQKYVNTRTASDLTSSGLSALGILMFHTTVYGNDLEKASCFYHVVQQLAATDSIVTQIRAMVLLQLQLEREIQNIESDTDRAYAKLRLIYHY